MAAPSKPEKDKRTHKSVEYSKPSDYGECWRCTMYVPPKESEDGRRACTEVQRPIAAMGGCKLFDDILK